MQTTIDKFMGDTYAFMQSSLPKVYEDTPQGQAVPLAGVDNQQVGSGVNMEQLHRAPEEMKFLMATKVTNPLQTWVDCFLEIQNQMKDLEVLRLEVDSRRRTVEQMTGPLNKMRSRHMEKGEQDPKMEDKINGFSGKCRHKEAKATETLSRYRSMEEEVFNQLSDLISN
eukprot:TRINITY_DN103226_c0_g1_i1.p2 TRINITY_DN103226_c0_g1~~TRINITY_DN103226_c0_g1_i1.p2  ORF type:complete len:176 (-),score=28.45 TRINITY_DN103226_c0_g1_i1:34-540(-)